jgi:anaphase-promoting complex subunit 2
MIRDLSDSKRINNQCRTQTLSQQQTTDFPLDATVVSYLYWPTFREEKFDVPDQIKELSTQYLLLTIVRKMQQYSKAYEGLKPTRQLVWKSHLGMVDVDLEFADRTLTFSLSPLQATIIMMFQESGKFVPLL